MKIDKVYISCCKRDYYFTRICISSIRYWNKDIPIVLLKDFSQGHFSTDEAERTFNVSTAPFPLKNVGAYGKLYPYMADVAERVFIIDSDTVWTGNLIPGLEQFDEDIVVDGKAPNDHQKEMNQWYFNVLPFKKYFPDYVYPGLLFNSGQIVLSTSSFSQSDFDKVIEWKENPGPTVPGVFLCEDQGILNYVVAVKLAKKEISLRSHHFFLWGWSEEAGNIKVADMRSKKPEKFLIHWYGKKNGLISFLPNSNLLKFYERYYFSHLRNGTVKMYSVRLLRTLIHLKPFLYELFKKLYYTFKPGGPFGGR
jgi:hypothetical protein